MSKQTDAVVKKNIIDGLNEIKKATSFPNPVKIKMGELVSKYKLPGYFPTIIKELSIISQVDAEGPTKGMYKWSFGVQEIDDTLASRILSKVRERYNLAKNLSKQAKATMVTSPNAVTSKPVIKLSGDNAVASRTMVKATPLAKREEIKGTLFGFRQLIQVKEMYRKKPTLVTIDDYIKIKNVKLITFEVDGSKLKVSLWMYADNERNPDPSSLISEFEIDNQVLAFKEGAEDELTSNLLIYTVKVSDPYDVKL